MDRFSSECEGSVEKNRHKPVLMAVDDDEMLINIIVEIFKNDAVLITAKNTTEALPLIRQNKPDLILLDDMMPGGVSGLSFLEVLRDDPDIADIPVIMLTASNKPEEMVRGLRAGAVDYITKPFKPSNLAASVMARLQKQKNFILVVNEDEDLRTIISHKFQKMDCRVVTCSNGAEALRYLKAEKPTFVITDRLTSEIDGVMMFQFMRQSEDLCDVPVLFFVDKKEEAALMQSYGFKNTEIMVKPVNPDEVLLTSARLIRQKTSG